MKVVIFGLSISSSWGNGHATLWRGLCDALGSRGHQVVFFEKNVSYYADNRDGVEFPGCDLRLYEEWTTTAISARGELADADVGMVTSYCPDGVEASALVLDSKVRVKVFYDLDTPVTLAQLALGGRVDYLPSEGLGSFDLVLSYTGGQALTSLREKLGARRVAALYGSVNPKVHRPVDPVSAFASDLSYLGTYSEDRQEALQRLFVEPARQMPLHRFSIGGAQYPAEFPWTPNIHFLRHMPPPLHAAFYCSSRFTLNVTRRTMAAMGYCPQGRLFEAAACGVPILSDAWEGLEDFYTPGSEILVCETSTDVLAALSLGDLERQRVASAARERTFDEHTAEHRARELETILDSASSSGRENWRHEQLCGV